MSENIVNIEGEVVEIEQLKLQRAMEVAKALRASRSFSTLVECRATAESELIIFNVDVERPQRAVNDIRHVERLAARFYRLSDHMPEVLALRDDFPVVPHLNSREEIKPRNLCLYEQSWEEVRLTWTGSAFIERVRWWLARTARGELHGDDQPLEPLMLGHGFTIIVPSRFGLAGGSRSEIVQVRLVNGREGRVFVANKEPAPWLGMVPHLALYIETAIRQHGVIQKTPKSLADLVELVDFGDFSLLESMHDTLWSMPAKYRSDIFRKKLRVIVVLGLPKVRVADGNIEQVELKGFIFSEELERLGQRIGSWLVCKDDDVIPLKINLSKKDLGIHVLAANVVRELDFCQATFYSGLGMRDGSKILSIGAGALGSQVAMNLARSGFGRWCLIDDDEFMPHNAVRHSLAGRFMFGRNKAEAVAMYMNAVADDEPIAKAAPANFLRPGDSREEIQRAVEESDLVLDMSASIPVARAIAHKETSGRAFSLFLSPKGYDLVLLAEDPERKARLDELEMLYYGAVGSKDELSGHLEPSGGTTRYGAGCRDVSVQIAQAHVGMHAGIAASAIMRVVHVDTPIVRVWRFDPESQQVQTINVPVAPLIQQEQNDWQVLMSRDLLQNVSHWREKCLPNETGGILLGGIDHEHR